MSRVFQALEKAEEQRKLKGKSGSPFKIYQESAGLGKEGQALKFPKEEVEDLGLPRAEEAPVLIARPGSFAAEEFRKLKTQIFHCVPIPHSILVTSAAPQEGKTMVSVNLALAFSQEIQKKAVLIDADLRKPSIYLDKHPDPKGLSNYLSNQASLSEILVNSEAENLQIIPAGPPAKKSSELIGSRRMGELLKSLREFGDDTYVVIDSPPLISTAEPTQLSKIVDAVILVIRGGRTPRESIRRAFKPIERQKIIGIVFNQIDTNPSSYYYSRYYHYYRYYKK